MYANRYGGGRTFDPASLGVAVAINGAVVAALMLASPAVRETFFDPPIETYVVPPDAPPPPPEPTPPQPHQRTAPREQLEAPIPTVTPPTVTDFVTRTDPAPFPLPAGPIGTGTGGVAIDPPTPAPPPALVGPSLDGRYADDIQPTYPTEERRAEREGRVVVRVLVGVDGRVKQVERVEATSDAFYRVTERQALSRWRFKPATRGGIPVEGWYKLSLRFELKD